MHRFGTVVRLADVARLVALSEPSGVRLYQRGACIRGMVARALRPVEHRAFVNFSRGEFLAGAPLFR
jgi:hypothetical protein